MIMHIDILTSSSLACVQAAHSCGDLLFSSHTTFLLNGALTYSVYGSHLAIKAAVWFAVTCICFLIIASRKHYTGTTLCMVHAARSAVCMLSRRECCCTSHSSCC